MIKVVSINIEKDKYLDNVREFLLKEQAGVVCLQEVFMVDAVMLSKELEYQVFLGELAHHPRFDTGAIGSQGVALLVRLPVIEQGLVYYNATGSPMQLQDDERDQGHEKTYYRGVLWAELEVETGKTIKIGTLHHTITPNGQESEVQNRHTDALLRAADKIGPVVLVGDHNIPRGVNTNYERILEAGYRDMIPKQYKTSLTSLHRAWNDVPALRTYMVDYVFAPLGFAARDVRLIDGISDHCAIVAQVGLEEGN